MCKMHTRSRLRLNCPRAIADVYCNTLGESVIVELQSALSFFSKMVEMKYTSSLDKFRTAFYERYEEREVPLAIALDSELVKVLWRNILLV